jgi:hypothetical protein
MVPGKFLCGPVEHLSGPVKYGSQLVLHQYNFEMLFDHRCISFDHIITVYLSPSLTLVCSMEFLFSEFLFFFSMLALVLVCFISDLDVLPST